jgi:hypothetical protein
MKNILLAVAALVGINCYAENLVFNGGIKCALVGNYQFEVNESTGAVTIGEDEAILSPGYLRLQFSGPLGIDIINNDFGDNIPSFAVNGWGDGWFRRSLNVNNVFSVSSNHSLSIAHKLLNNTNIPTVAQIGENNGWLQVSNGVLYCFSTDGTNVLATRLTPDERNRKTKTR